MPAKHYNLDTRTDLGGESSSDLLVASQKATKAYVDAKVSDKQDSITGAASSITDSDLESNIVVVSDNSGKLTESSITTTELGYLENTTSNIQTQINSKADTNHDQASNTITTLEDYSKGTITGALSPSDSLNEALGKLENNLDGKADASEVTLVTIKDWTVS